MQDLTKLIIKFRDARNWKKFHQPKDLAISLMLEAGEVAEHFQWKSEKEIVDFLKKNNQELGDELADVLYWVLLISHDTGIDLTEALLRKMKKNEEKYPVKLAFGKYTKYTRLKR
ncbi:MAG: nucleotide pyrophosphohydrolase [Candidatus Pacebacteria bacterium RIFCSPHIGHO2_01_FULL_46_10]|nr:MAG: nucleotide pyrophosphohydrolase [Candidatus Pacebacteria bacterium RIFCSPHIGHO2_01_FULL_46_10]